VITRQQGVVLILMIWVVLLGSVLALSLSGASRSETRQVAARVAGAQARAAAESGIWRAIDGLIRGDTQNWPIDGTPFARDFAGVGLKVAIQSQSGLVDLNRAAESLLREVIAGVLRDSERGAELSDEILDWRDADSEVRPQGAEFETYQALGMDGAPRDGPFNTAQAMRRLASISSAEYALLVPLFTVHSQRDGVVHELAPAQILWALPQLSDDEVETVLLKRQARADDVDYARGDEDRLPARQVGTAFEVFVEARSANATRRLSAVVLTRRAQRPPYAILAWHEHWYDRDPFAPQDIESAADARSP
jgi:general secretion pathway protein K